MGKTSKSTSITHNLQSILYHRRISSASSPSKRIWKSCGHPGMKKTRSSSRNGISKDDLLTSHNHPLFYFFIIWCIHAFVCASIEYETGIYAQKSGFYFSLPISSARFQRDKVAVIRKFRKSFKERYRNHLLEKSVSFKSENKAELFGRLCLSCVIGAGGISNKLLEVNGASWYYVRERKLSLF